MFFVDKMLENTISKDEYLGLRVVENLVRLEDDKEIKKNKL